MSKGSQQRPPVVTKEESDRLWDKAFPKEKTNA